MRSDGTYPVRVGELVRRANQALRHDGLRVKRNPISDSSFDRWGEFCLVNRSGQPVRTAVDLEALGRELCVLDPLERLSRRVNR